jgi:hypothetical protein
METMSTSFSLGNNDYPKTKEKALDALSNHKIDKRYFDLKKKARDEKPNHIERKEKNEDDGSKRSFAQGSKEKMTCYCCGKKGHAAPECPDKNKIPKEQWHVNKAMSHLQDKGKEDYNSEQAVQKKKAWSGFQQCHNTTENEDMGDVQEFSNIELKDVFILDTGSTIGATIMNPRLLSNVKTTTSPLEMVTNAGTKKLFKKGDIEGFGEAWYDPNQVANIFGFAKLEDKYRITYDSNKESAFSVHTDDGIVKFVRNQDGLYVYRPSNDYLESVGASYDDKEKFEKQKNFFIETLDENKKGYTQRQFEDAKRCWKNNVSMSALDLPRELVPFHCYSG